MKYKEAWIAHIKANNIKGSGTATSYISSLNKLDGILERTSLFGHTDLWGISSVGDIDELYHFALENQKHEGSVFLDGKLAPSYALGGYYSAALRSYCQFMVAQQYTEQLWDIYQVSKQPAAELSNKLSRKRVQSAAYLIDESVDLKSKEGKDALRSVKTRLGQGFFRDMILQEYNSTCCVTGLTVPEVLRASHISGWAKDSKNRLNPANGLCLSATYDAAFDKHLISFDEKHRLILSPVLKEFYSNEAFKEYFLSKEGTPISRPKRFLPDQILLQKHREKLAA